MGDVTYYVIPNMNPGVRLLEFLTPEHPEDLEETMIYPIIGWRVELYLDNSESASTEWPKPITIESLVNDEDWAILLEDGRVVLPEEKTLPDIMTLLRMRQSDRIQEAAQKVAKMRSL